jgi:hypothetical protein
MARTLMAVVLLVAVTQAQIGVLSASQPQPATKDPAAFPQTFVEAFPRYMALRRGTEEKVLLTAALNWTTRDLTATYWAAPSPKNGSLVATELTIEPLEGFATRAIEYPRSQKVLLRLGEERLRLLGPGSIDLHFKLRADRTVALGDHVLKGKLRFQQVSRVGDSGPRQLEFSIPIRVVENNAVVSKDTRFRQSLTPIQKAGLVILIPLVIPLAIIGALTGWDGC